MAQFLSDTFTDTNGVLLQNHTPDAGGTWSKFLGTNDITINNNVGLHNTVDTLAYENAATPAGASYTVSCNVRSFVATDANRVGVVGRRQSGASTFYTGYLFGGSAGARGARLSKFISGSETVLGTYLFDFLDNTFYNLRLEVNGSLIRLYVDGILRISVNDSSISGAGKAGVYGVVAANRVNWDNLRGVDILTKPYSDSVVGGDTIATPRKTKAYSDISGGGDTIAIPRKIKGYSDISTGSEAMNRLTLLPNDYLGSVFEEYLLVEIY